MLFRHRKNAVDPISVCACVCVYVVSVRGCSRARTLAVSGFRSRYVEILILRTARASETRVNAASPEAMGDNGERKCRALLWRRGTAAGRCGYTGRVLSGGRCDVYAGREPTLAAVRVTLFHVVPVSFAI